MPGPLKLHARGFVSFNENIIFSANTRQENLTIWRVWKGDANFFPLVVSLRFLDVLLGTNYAKSFRNAMRHVPMMSMHEVCACLRTLLAKGYLVMYIKAPNVVLFLSYHFIAVNKRLIRAAGSRRSSELSILIRTCPSAKLVEVLLMNLVNYDTFDLCSINIITLQLYRFKVCCCKNIN